VAASVASNLIGQRQAVGLLTNGRDAPTQQPMAPLHARTGQGQLMNILTQLARVEMHETEYPLSAWLPSRIADLEWGATLVVVTPLVDEPLLWVLHGAYRASHAAKAASMSERRRRGSMAWLRRWAESPGV
jgi:hypothetical protein